ncbi:Peptidyl-prolyl cis-trans isomerase B [Candidatus Cyrtobacter comes]|uniref:Peptidyl-prolyl cis-trans isomerase n=2 Tax=Candidatus Cyrtobacter comes TaxID=675776 RepID=A0ABU5L9C2_9RICK|nr:Peptidyl-prolyl cis-trans isomerase B [Candidatus Cyrtobacter comes]
MPVFANQKMIRIDLKYGSVYIELYPSKAPMHVQRIIDLANDGFYDGLYFHRVIDGFIAQTGDPKGDGTGRSKFPNLEPEFNDIKHVKGIVSMARASDPASANSQFFIMLGDAPHLDENYTVFGKVIKGMEFVEMIKIGDKKENGKVKNPDRILSMKVVDDFEEN